MRSRREFRRRLPPSLGAAVDGKGPAGAPLGVRARVCGGLALLLALLVAGCGGEDARVRVHTVTPVPVGSTAETPAPVEAPALIASVEEVAQGSAILVSVTGGVAEGAVEFLGRSHPLLQGDFSMYTFVAVGAFDPPGRHPLRVRLTLANGSTGSFEREINVHATEWETAHIIYVEGEGDPVLDLTTRANEDALLAATYAVETPAKLWSGPWRAPVAGAISGQFGERRSINGEPADIRHGGTDFAVPEGAPVTAANSGRVALARQLAVRGNMVVIDHGGGVLSGYAHLSSFAVAEGQLVEAGQLIAFAGNSGFSTASHLHWEVSVHGTLVDPLRFIDGRNGL